MLEFEWDAEKARSNERKHGIRFADARVVFADPQAWFEPDFSAEYGETRWRVIGLAGPVALLLVVHTIRGFEGREIIRIISARRATLQERRRYEQNSP